MWALWLAAGKHGFVWGEMVGREIFSLGVFLYIFPVLGWSVESRYALLMLGKWSSLPRLVTRTKESNIYASKRVANSNAK